MPTKNRRAFWPRALAMFAAQDYPNTELVIVEDGDGDGVADSGLPELSRRLRYSRFEGTLGAKLNRAAALAAGEYCINWDDDDWNAPNRISTQVAHMQLTGAPVVGLSSLIYYAEGDTHGWEYTGDAWYASGSTHAYRRDYVLAHPRPDRTVGEDNIWIAEAHRLNAVSTMSRSTILVACDHTTNCSARQYAGMDRDFVRATTDNFRKVPLSEFAATIGPYGSH